MWRVTLWRKPITSRNKDKLEEQLLKLKSNYFGFDLDFILCVLPKIKNIHKVLSSKTIVLTEETIDYITFKKDTERTDLRFRYAYNLLTELSKTIQFIFIPETKQHETFSEFLTLHNLNTMNPADRCVAYYKFFENHIPHPSDFALLTCNANTKHIAQRLEFHNLVYYAENT